MNKMNKKEQDMQDETSDLVGVLEGFTFGV
jgi:hypothetical protein